MVAAFEVVERLAGAGLHPARAVQYMRHLMDAGVIRRGPRGRPSSSRAEYTFEERADIILGLAAQLPINAPKKVSRLAGYISEPGPVVDELFALPEQGSTQRSWLIAVLQRLAALPLERRKGLYRAKVVPTLTFRDELTSPYPHADIAKFAWGNQYIHFRPPDVSLRDVLEERLPKLRPYYSIEIEIGLLLDLTPPVATPESEDAAALPRAAASPIPADAEQLATARRQPGLSNPTVSVGVSESNRSAEPAGQVLMKESPHATRHRRR
jgi:hypothetical protein